MLCVADLTENGLAMPIAYQDRSGRPSLAVMAGSGRFIAPSVDERRISGRLDVFARPRPNSPPAGDHGWQGTMCG